MTIAVIGPGLIGRSVTLAARRADDRVQVVEIDRGDPVGAATGADLIVLATPVDVTLTLLRAHADVFRSSICLDTGSTKQHIIRAAREARLARFVGGHPMAGGATPGPGGARADLFDGRPWFLVPHGAEPNALRHVQDFITTIGATPIVLHDDGAEHDRVMAAVSHLPQAVATVLMTVAARAAGERLSWAGAGLKDTTRLASSSSSMWASILATNADALRPLLRETASELNRVADQLDDAEVIGELFRAANRARATLDE